MKNTDKIVALLPMKANSNRIPGKNFKTIAGKPLFRWILDTLLEIRQIDKIVINTDAFTELRECGFQANEFDGRVMLRKRNPEICGDDISMNSILLDDIQEVHADHYLMTHTTNPLLSAETVSLGLTRYLDALPTRDSLFSVNRHQTRFYTQDAQPINHDPNNLIPTQDLTPYYEENSCFYLFSAASFRSTNARIGSSPLMYEIPKIEAVDIDEQGDWDMANALLSQRQTPAHTS